ncbi:probable aspartyl protease At4g16563 [Rhodamnia argentea]|uniref:Probable aspartyl protease At4g16563 n=1 Tax=Rhodamnia argentea TaxID=178133 RepID=A0A8B8QQ82_9MYRT|nr:probable aspartyl protease At4g16563 [Rhodamnia argentea]
MALPPPPLLFISFLFSLAFSSSAAAGATTITLSLTPFLPKHPRSSSSAAAASASDDNSSWQSQMLNLLATSSLARAHHLKKHNSSSSSTPIKVPSFPRSYGGYSIDLGFGTPAQTLTFVMDTGSSLLWFPCTSRYACASCSFPSSDPSKIRRFIPKLSSSAKLVGCRNPKCAWIFGPAVASRCHDECASGRNCSQQTCPPYIIQYGSGNTAGVLLSETLSFSEDRKVPNFLAGCSLFSTRQPAGIAGFGRGSESLPSQMGLRRFSYCLLSRRFDDTSASSDLVLYPGRASGPGSGGDRKTDGVVYTPFRANPGLPGSAFKDYYYISLRKVLVGGKAVKVPHRYLVPGADGNGGAIVDSGSTFTFMERPVLDAVAEELERQMANYSRAKGVEARTGLRPCFNVSGRGDAVRVPELSLQFKGGARMALPLENYLVLVGEGSGVACVAIVTDDAPIGPEVSGGPAVILGSFQQQNFFVEYDLENERLGFRKQNCKVE